MNLRHTARGRVGQHPGPRGTRGVLDAHLPIRTACRECGIDRFEQPERRALECLALSWRHEGVREIVFKDAGTWTGGVVGTKNSHYHGRHAVTISLHGAPHEFARAAPSVSARNSRGPRPGSLDFASVVEAVGPDVSQHLSHRRNGTRYVFNHGRTKTIDARSVHLLSML
jgi:hypothetical protein